MKIFGLVGGVASGKSLVASLFAELGAGVLDADQAGHEVLAQDAEVKQALVGRWGPSILTPLGDIDRKSVAERVFGDSAANGTERKFLEDLLHPRIKASLQRQMTKLAAEGCPAAVLDAPLLLEAGWDTLCDTVVLVDSDREQRFSRVKARGWTAAEFARREAAQWPVETKRAAANAIIQNEGTIDELRAAVRDVWQRQIAS